MKTNDIIHSLECCPKDLCGECSFEEHMNCTNVLARAAADHLVELRMGNEWCCYTGNGWVTAADESESPTHWIPIPKPPEPPKKVKTYADVFFEAFPDGNIEGVQSRLCINVFFPLFKRQKCMECNDCWNQPYEEEGEAE